MAERRECLRKDTESLQTVNSKNPAFSYNAVQEIKDLFAMRYVAMPYACLEILRNSLAAIETGRVPARRVCGRVQSGHSFLGS